jgi:hypothetical protein
MILLYYIQLPKSDDKTFAVCRGIIAAIAQKYAFHSGLSRQLRGNYPALNMTFTAETALPRNKSKSANALRQHRTKIVVQMTEKMSKDASLSLCRCAAFSA